MRLHGFAQPLLLLPLVAAVAAAGRGSAHVERSNLRPSSPSRARRDQAGQAFCIREIIDEKDESNGVVFHTISGADLSATAAADAQDIATGIVKILVGTCGAYCADDDATFDMNKVRELCGPTAYDCTVDEHGWTGSCWMAIDAEEEYDEDTGTVEDSEEKEEDGDDASAGHVEWNENEKDFEVEVGAKYDEEDNVVYDKKDGSVVIEGSGKEKAAIVAITKEETSVVTEHPKGNTVAQVERPIPEEEKPNCLSCHYFDRVRWMAAGKHALDEYYYDRNTNNPSNPDECLGAGRWFGTVAGMSCEEAMKTDHKYEICGRYPRGTCEPSADWKVNDKYQGKKVGLCLYLCDDSGPADGGR